MRKCVVIGCKLTKKALVSAASMHVMFVVGELSYICEEFFFFFFFFFFF
jgi:hypothetical protein